MMCDQRHTHKLGFGGKLVMNAIPLAKAVPHPTVEGAWTIDDPFAKLGDHVPMIASKVNAGVIAEKRNEQRRPK